jgi:hypothetical protein
MKAALQNYQARMRRVLDYIDRHLDSDHPLAFRVRPFLLCVALREVSRPKTPRLREWAGKGHRGGRQ